MEMLQYQIKGSDHGISSGDFFIDLPAVVDGIPLYDGNGNGNYPRNAEEKRQFDMLISQFQKVESQQQANTTGGSPATRPEFVTLNTLIGTLCVLPKVASFLASSSIPRKALPIKGLT